MRITITCKQCGRVAEVEAKPTSPRIYCSNACYHKSKRGRPTPIPFHLLGGGIEGHRKQAYALRGRVQTAEHKQKRAISTAEKLSTIVRECRHCKEQFTPTQGAQYYCSGRCWNAVHRKRDPSTRFTISPVEYNRLLALQNGICAICGVPSHGNRRKDRLAVDHCHKTKHVRGLLCHRCNTAIGLMKDNVKLLKSAVRYLEITAVPKTNGQQLEFELEDTHV